MRCYLFIFIFLPIYSVSQSLLIDTIEISGNKRTKPFILYRELPFKIGDTIDICNINSSLKKAKENILNTSLYNFADVDTFNTTANTISISIKVTERWYFWPIPIFEQASRNLNTWFYEKDYDRINYGLFFALANFRGRNELLRFVFRRGFREQYGFAYSNPGIGKKQKVGYEIKYLYYRQKKLAYSTVDSKPVDLYTNKYNYQNSSGSISFTYRPGIYNWHFISVSYNNHFLSDTLFVLNPNFIENFNQNIQYFSAQYSFTRDIRNSNYYPLKGYYFMGTVTKTGFGIFKTEPNFFTLNIKVSKYFEITKRIYGSTAGQVEYSNRNKPSFIFSKAFGYGNYTKGMELYVVDGNGFGLWNNSIRYQLVKPHTKQIKILKAEKFSKFHYAFYTSLNFDLGYVINQTHAEVQHANEYLYGYGIGLDFVTYYDIVLRIEASRNKFGETGIFLHFNAPF
jgi:outer membrane protein assembly factor BamA